MNKANLIENVAEATGLKKKDAEKAVNAVFASIRNALESEDKIQLAGFGTFKVKERKERVCRNPRSEGTITVPASKVPAFVPAKGLKDAVNG